jgi:hypothetical protein
MKGRLSLLAASFLSFLIVQAGWGELISFDNITSAGGYTNEVAVTNGYGGLNWSGFDAVNAYLFNNKYSNTGVRNGMVSSSNVVCNAFGGLATISSAGDFTVSNVDLSSCWLTGMSIGIKGYNGASLIDSTTIVVNTTAPTLLNLDWQNISSMTFTAFGGSNAGLGSTMETFVMDNLSVSVVPEPSAFLLVSVGLVALGSGLRRRSRR